MQPALTALVDRWPFGTAGRWLPAVLVGAIAFASLSLATAIVWVLEGDAIGIEDASAVYLIAVVAVGALAGTWPAVGTAVAAFVVYDVLFTEPRYSLQVADPREWLDLVLFMFVALVIGRLVAIQHARADEAAARAAEANSLFALSRSLATAPSTEEAAPDLLTRLIADVRLRRASIMEGPTGSERLIADSGGDRTAANPSIVTTLVRTPGDAPAHWVRTHAAPTRPGSASVTPADTVLFRVRIELDGAELGAVLASRDRTLGLPNREETRILALAADQIAISLRRDQLRRTATDLEVARQTDSLKTALIDSVSHDLRTPLASIRATAGSLADPAITWTDDRRRAAAAVIDAEASRLDRLVRGLLDLSRISSGAVHPDLEPHEVWSLVLPVIDRLRPALGERAIKVAIPDALPPVLADAVLVDIIVTNLLDNAAVHAGPDATVEISAEEAADGNVRLTVADGGPGVPSEALATLFDRFRRVPRRADGARRGLGIGLSVVKGLVEAMGGTVAATPSTLGGLAVTVTLRIAPVGPER